jgi:hypothetical protein
MDRITVRIASIEDARGILEAHYSAVHETADPKAGGARVASKRLLPF